MRVTKVIGIAVAGGLLLYYVIYYMLFGWQMELEQGLQEFFGVGYSDAFETIDYDINGNPTTYWYQLRTYEENGVRYIVEIDRRSGEESEPIILSDYMAKASGMKKLIDSNFINIKDNGTWLLDDEDVESVFKRIIMDEKEKEKESYKSYQYIKKEYDYTTQSVFVGFDDMGGEIWEDQRTGPPAWQPSAIWDPEDLSQWFRAWDGVSLRAKGPEDFRSETNADGTDRYLIRWHFLISLLEMSSTHNYGNWGGTDESDANLPEYGYGDVDGYYLTNEFIDEMIEELSYEFTFWWDGTTNIFNTIYYNDMEKFSYRLDIKEMDPNPSVGDVAYIKKIPATSPKKTQNIYETITYNYEPVTDGYGSYILVDRSITWDVRPLYDLFMEVTDGHFSWRYFYETLEKMPGHEGALQLAHELENAYEYNIANDEPYPYSIHEPFAGAGVRIGTKLGERLDEEDDPEWDPGDDDEYLDGDFEYVYMAGWGGTYAQPPGWYAISEGARANLLESDNLSLEQIKTLLDYYEGISGKPSGANMRDAAEAMYAWQQSGNGSITGVLAIWMTEAPWLSGLTYGTSHALDHWNFGNVKTNNPDEGFIGAQGKLWKDYKKIYSNFGDALVAQMNMKSNSYWKSGQYTFYSMSLWTPSGPYAAQTPEEAHNNFTHCYCPCFDDPSFRTMPEKVANPAYTGWCNSNALNRQRLLGALGG